MKRTQSDSELSLEEEIIQSYPSDLLVDIFGLYFKSFLDATDKFFTNWNLDKREFEGLTIRKREIARLFAIILSDEEIFSSWVESLPYMVLKVFETVVWEGEKRLSELNARTKGYIVKEGNLQHVNRDVIQPEYCLFLLTIKKYRDFDGNPVTCLDLPCSVRKSCRRYLSKPKGYHLRGLKTLDSTTYKFCDKGKVLKAFPVIVEFIKQGHLEVTKSGMLSRHSLSRLSKQCELDELFPVQEDSAAKLMRIELVAYLIHRLNLVHDKPDSIEFLKEIVHQYANQTEPSFIRLFDHIKGWYHAAKYFQVDFNREFKKLITELPPEKWISYKQFKRFLQVRDFTIQVIREEACKYLHIPGDWDGWGNKRHPLLPRHIPDMILNPSLQINLYFFVALGMLDIRYDPPGEEIEQPDGYTFRTPYDGIKYLKLNSLGAFVLGISQSYKSDSHQEVPTELFLDDDRLLISISKPDARIEMILEQIGVRIGRLRFKVDNESMLKGCEHVDDLIAKINRFSSLLGGGLPKNWIELLNSVRKKSYSLSYDEEMLVLNVNPEDDTLVELFRVDRKLRQLVLMAEDYRVLIRKRDIAHFRQRMRIFGYLF